MGVPSLIWTHAKRCLTAGLITLTFSDNVASISQVHGASMFPTFNPRENAFTVDCVLLEKLCCFKYRFSHGDVIAFWSPEDHKKRLIKRIIGLPGDWITIPHSLDIMRVPPGHCWVEGDNSAHSKDSRSFGPIPLGLICGRATHVVWPPQRISKIERRIPLGRLTATAISPVASV